MSNASSPLQFDQADFGGPASGSACGLCREPLHSEYFRAGTLLACGSCRPKLEQALNAKPTPGAWVRALLFGSGAALLGAGLYYGVTKLTGYELGLISVAVGVLVGRAVRKGSGGRGGRSFQLLAVALAYLAMAGSYVPFVVEAMVKRNAAAAAPTEVSSPGTTPAPAAVQGPQTEATTQVSPAAPAGEPAQVAHVEAEAEKPMGALSAIAMLFGLFLALPFQIALESPISGLIMAFALWEGWRVNRRVEVAIEGPFAVGASAAPELGTASGG